MKAVIKIVTAEKEFSHEQIQFIKRMAGVLISHHQLSVMVEMKVKKTKKLKLKAV
jgi:hypothetical protein